MINTLIMLNKPRFIILHTTDYSYRLLADQFIACNGWHRDRDFPLSSLGLYIGYHSLITGEKNYRCRTDSDEGAHCNQRQDGVSMNFQSLGVCLGFDGDIEMPTAMQYALLQKQVWEWQDMYGIPHENVRFHRYYAKDKTCPGSLITDTWLKTLLTRPTMPVAGPKPPETMCIAQEQTIKDLKKKLTWFETVFSWLRTPWLTP